MTSTQHNPASTDADAAVQQRLADLDQRLSQLREHRAADPDAENYQQEGAVLQDGITDEHGFGYGTGYTDRHHGEVQGSHRGY